MSTITSVKMPRSYQTIQSVTSLDKTEECSENIVVPGQAYLRMYIAAFAALLHVVGFGLFSSYSAPASIDMKRSNSRIHVTEDQVTWIASLGAISGIFGGPVSGYLSDKLGRKAVLIYVSLPYVASWLMVAYAPTLEWLYAGRFLTGFCCGMIVTTVPIYIVEISTTDVRGFLGAGFQVAFAAGVLMAMALGMVLTWSWLAIAGAITIAFSAILLYFMPESPHWLVANGKEEEAIQALQFLRCSLPNSFTEYQNIMRLHSSEPKMGVTFKELMKPYLFKPMFLSIFLMFFLQGTGINAIMSYIVEIMQRVGSSIDPSTATVVIAGIQVFSGILSCVLMDKAGRRVLYLISGLFVTFSLGLLGLFSLLTADKVIQSLKFGWVPTVGFIIYVTAFNLGFGPIPWLMIPEMSPTHARSMIVSIAGISNWIFMFVLTKTYENFRFLFNDYGTFWIYGIISFTGCIFCWFYLPETKGKSLKEIQAFILSKETESLITENFSKV